MTRQFGIAVSSRPELKQPEQSKPVGNTTAQILQNRYDFHLNVLKQYVIHAQRVENKNKATVTTEVSKLADALVERYRFGAKFFSEINKFIGDQYQQPTQTIYAEIKKNSGIEEGTFESLVDEMRKSGIMEGFSPRFRAVFS